MNANDKFSDQGNLGIVPTPVSFLEKTKLVWDGDMTDNGDAEVNDDEWQCTSCKINGFMATHAFGHMMYGLTWNFIFLREINYAWTKNSKWTTWEHLSWKILILANEMHEGSCHFVSK